MVSVPAASCSTSLNGTSGGLPSGSTAVSHGRSVSTPSASRCFSWILPHQGDDDTFDGLVKPDRVGNAVVEPFAIAERVVHEVGEPCFGGDLDAELFHLVENVIECFAILQPPVGGQLPRLLADGAVGLFQKRRHLRQGAFLAAKRDGHGANGLLILLLELGQLGFAGDVCLAKQAAAVLERTIEHEIAVSRQLRSIRRVEVAARGSRSGSA